MLKNRRSRVGSEQRGFTIVELMIATTIFSFVLLVASTGIIAIGRMYYKGITSSKTQEVARSIIEDVSRARQFSGGNITSGSTGSLQSVCFGEDRYTYNINNRVTNPDDTDTTSWGIRHDVRPDVGSCDPASSGGVELLDKNMRLLRFSVSRISGGQFSINVKVAYGEDDLLSAYDNNGALNGDPIDGALCKGGIAGSNFCATSELATVVDKRIE